MSDRITDKDLENLVDWINKLTGNPLQSYTKTESGYKSNIGNYHISGAYGGVTIYQMITDGGGVRDVLYCGFTTERDLYNRLQAFIKGIEIGKEQKS